MRAVVQRVSRARVTPGGEIGPGLCVLLGVARGDGEQQAARLADRTGFFLLGKLIEIDDTRKIFQNPSKKETEDYVTGRFG